MISRFRATNLPSKEPCTSASSVVLSPLKTPPSLMTTFGQSASVASILPWTISRLQEVISPLTDTPVPIIGVRTSASLSDRGCDAASCGVEERSGVGRSSVVFHKGSVGFEGFWSPLSAGLLALPSSRPENPPEAAPEFTLTPSQVTTAPPSPVESAETAPAPSRLRYVAVPPGHQVGGMAHARIVVKQKKAPPHRSRHALKKAVSPAAAVETPTETAKPTSKP